jgi:hypothetical protein
MSVRACQLCQQPAAEHSRATHAVTTVPFCCLLCSQEQIKNQIATLNAAYAGTFTFTLANATWYSTNSTALFYADSDTSEEASIKRQLRKGTARTLNIYTWEPKDPSSSSNTLGWATFPWKYNASSSLDGVVLLHSTINGGSYKGYNLGDTAVHEVGHWAGLYQTFQVRK